MFARDVAAGVHRIEDAFTKLVHRRGRGRADNRRRGCPELVGLIAGRGRATRYVPGPRPPRSGPARAWEAGEDGRAVLDQLCAAAPEHLRPGGVVLIVHSEVCGAQTTLRAYAAGDLADDVVARERGPLGPLLRERRTELERRGLLRPGQREEEVLVLRGRARDAGSAAVAERRGVDLATAPHARSEVG
jgi:hypothetical protein